MSKASSCPGSLLGKMVCDTDRPQFGIPASHTPRPEKTLGRGCPCSTMLALITAP